MRRSGVAVRIAFATATMFGIANAIPRSAGADKIGDSSRQLTSSRDYKVRLSAALFLGKQSDRRAVRALTLALDRDGETTVRRVAALSLGNLSGDVPAKTSQLAIAALTRAAGRDNNPRVRASAQGALTRLRATLARAERERAPPQASGRLFLHVGKPSDLSRSLPHGSEGVIHAALRGSLRRNAPEYQQQDRGAPPTSSQLAARRLTGYYVGAQVARIAIEPVGSQAEVRCTVSVRISPWSGRDGHERFVANRSASATGSGKVSASRRDSKRAAVDCAVAVAEELAMRQVIPFLRRVAAN